MQENKFKRQDRKNSECFKRNCHCSEVMGREQSTFLLCYYENTLGTIEERMEIEDPWCRDTESGELFDDKSKNL